MKSRRTNNGGYQMSLIEITMMGRRERISPLRQTTRVQWRRRSFVIGLTFLGLCSTTLETQAVTHLPSCESIYEVLNMSQVSSSKSPAPPQWVIDLNNPQRPRPRNTNVANPPGYTEAASAGKVDPSIYSAICVPLLTL